MVTLAQDPYETFASRFVDNYNTQNFDANYDLTAEGFQKQVTKEYFAQIFNSVWQSAGKFDSYKQVESSTQGRVFHLLSATQTFALSVSLDAAGKAAGLFIKPVDRTAEKDAQALLDKWKENSSHAGLVIGKLANGKTDIQFYGVADKSTTKPLNEQSIFELGSISKPFTGILLHTLMADGKISLSDPVNKFLPEASQLPKVNEKDILVRHLVTHSSCLPRMPGNFHPKPDELNNPYKHYSEKDLLEFLPKAPVDNCELEASPTYSNLGAGLLGYIVASFAGKTYTDLFTTRIALPLKVKNFGVLDKSDDWVSGHTHLGAYQPQWEFTDALVGAGGIDGNARDLTKVLTFLMSPDQSSLGKAVTASAAMQLKGPQGAFGTFWIRQASGSKTLVWHNGMTGGFSAFIGWVEGTQTGVFVMANNGEEIATALGLALLSEY
jgi:CubicO group peptidase (beta-lactamase class C family)